MTAKSPEASQEGLVIEARTVRGSFILSNGQLNAIN